MVKVNDAVEIDDGDVEQSHDSEEIKALTKEFVDRLKVVDNEIETLREDRKALIGEFKKKLDMPTLAAAMRIAKIKEKVAHKDSFDLFTEILDQGI